MRAEAIAMHGAASNVSTIRLDDEALDLSSFQPSVHDIDVDRDMSISKSRVNLIFPPPKALDYPAVRRKIEVGLRPKLSRRSRAAIRHDDLDAYGGSTSNGTTRKSGHTSHIINAPDLT